MLEKSPRRSDKRNGEWAEAQFVADAMRQGFDVFRPIGDSAAIDFIVSKRNTIKTIQVKATWVDYNGKSKWNIGKGSSAKLRYTDQDIDFFALYDGTLGAWRFVRPSETNEQKTFKVAQNETNKLENWNDLETRHRGYRASVPRRRI
jgi:Holliday junction resolvase